MTRKYFDFYGISYKTFIDPKPLLMRFKKIDGFNIIYDGARCLRLFGSETYDAIFSHYFANIKVDSLHIRKILTLDNIITLIKKVLNKDRNNYY